jgi:hypothetical protein
MFYNGDAKMEPGAVVCRVSPSFVRFGTFQLPVSRGGLQTDLVKLLADYGEGEGEGLWGLGTGGWEEVGWEGGSVGGWQREVGVVSRGGLQTDLVKLLADYGEWAGAGGGG